MRWLPSFSILLVDKSLGVSNICNTLISGCLLDGKGVSTFLTQEHQCGMVFFIVLATKMKVHYPEEILD
jgi:hypothetical protein